MSMLDVISVLFVSISNSIMSGNPCQISVATSISVSVLSVSVSS